MSAVNDIQRARAALMYFHNEAVGYDAYTFKFDDFVKVIQDRSHGVFLEGFGFALATAEPSESQIRDAMERLARDGAGRLPASNQAFFNYLSGSATQTSFLSGLSETAIGTVQDLAKGAQNVGDAVIKTGGILTGIGPYVVVGALLFIVAMRSKQLAGA